MRLNRVKEVILGGWLLYALLFVICLNPVFPLALWANEKSRQRLKQMLAKGGLAL